MSLPSNLSLDTVSAIQVWEQLDAEAQRLAARAVFTHHWDDGSARREATEAVAEAMRFREVMVKKLPIEKRVEYLLRRVELDESLAGTLLMALHLGHRRPMLSAFLDHLEIRHEDGTIDEDDGLEPVPADSLRGAANRLVKEFPQDEVEVYLMSLLALDDDTWGGLREVLPELMGPKDDRRGGIRED